MGSNEGNLLYINSVYRTLSARGQKVTSGGYYLHREEDPSEWIAQTNRNYDAFVIPLANAFRYGHGETLAKYTEVIKRLDIPVHVVGVGAQAGLSQAEVDADQIRMARTGSKRKLDEKENEAHNAIVRDFVNAVLDRSALLGVRGEVTKRYLTGIGIDGDRVAVIGCPSMYTWGPEFAMRDKLRGGLTTDSPIGMSVDYRIRAMAETVMVNTERYRRLVSPAQDQKSARMIITGEDQFNMANFDERMPIHTGHPLFQERRLLYYPSPWAWIESYRNRDFTFGTRLHGTIAGLLGGAPGHLLVHDTRTLELAELHKIPYSLITSFTEPPTAEELYERTDMGPFLESYPALFSNYVDFLHRNGLATRFDRMRETRSFDRKIKSVAASEPVLPRILDAQRR